MPQFGVMEIAIVLVIGLLVFGPKKLPELGRGLGSSMRDFRRGLSGEADNDPPAQPVVVQSTTPIVETAVPSAERVAEPVPVAEPVAAAAAAAAADPVAAAEPDAATESDAATEPEVAEVPVADAKPAE